MKRFEEVCTGSIAERRPKKRGGQPPKKSSSLPMYDIPTWRTNAAAFARSGNQLPPTSCSTIATSISNREASPAHKHPIRPMLLLFSACLPVPPSPVLTTKPRLSTLRLLMLARMATRTQRLPGPLERCREFRSTCWGSWC